MTATNTKPDFSAELSVYESHRDEWISGGRVGEYVVIHGKHVAGFFSSADDAFKFGCETYGLERFFMSSILPRDAVNLTRFGRVV
jgi:hypothetical protein